MRMLGGCLDYRCQHFGETVLSKFLVYTRNIPKYIGWCLGYDLSIFFLARWYFRATATLFYGKWLTQINFQVICFVHFRSLSLSRSPIFHLASRFFTDTYAEAIPFLLTLTVAYVLLTPYVHLASRTVLTLTFSLRCFENLLKLARANEIIRRKLIVRDELGPTTITADSRLN